MSSYGFKNNRVVNEYAVSIIGSGTVALPTLPANQFYKIASISGTYNMVNGPNETLIVNNVNTQGNSMWVHGGSTVALKKVITSGGYLAVLITVVEV